MKNLFRTFCILALLFLTPVTSAHAAKMALSPGSAEFRSGCINALNIILNTEGVDTRAVDAFLRYNPDEIEIIDQVSGIPGMQLRAGNIYKSYPGNIAQNGIIRLTAFNQNGFFNGRGILASIVFKSKPGVEQTSIGFNFVPGHSTDSNVADPESFDILNGVYGGTYTFKPGPCKADTTPPWIEDRSPDSGEVNVSLDSNVTFVIKDDQSGVDLNSLRVQVNDITYTRSGKYPFSYQGRTLKYKIIIDPVTDFLARAPVKVKINAQDLEQNVMPEVVYSFNELIPAEACRCPPCPEELRPAAPPDYYKFIISLLILLLLSMLYNLKLYLSEEKHKKHKFFKSHFIKRRLKKR